MFPIVLGLFQTLGAGEIIFLVLLFFLLFGAHKIPEIARAVGRAQREFQRARDEIETDARAAAPSEDERVRKAARDLGLPVDGRSTQELKDAIARSVQTGAAPGAPPRGP